MPFLDVRTLCETMEDEGRYEEKLQILCQHVEEIMNQFKTDKDKMIDDIPLWPQVEFGQIYMHLIDTPDLYTRS